MSKYLYIDDAAEADVDTYRSALRAAAKVRGLELEIDILPPPADLRMEEMLASIKPDGLLIDIELEKAVDATSRPYPMTGTALAQNIRDLQNAEKLPEIPLVRLSQKDVIRKWVGNDHTSHDLFDRYFDKAQVAGRAAFFAETLAVLHAGYVKLASLKPLQVEDFPDVLGIDNDFYRSLHPALLQGFRENVDGPAHNMARFISANLLAGDGPLICESTLAARLGVNSGSSDSAWTDLLKSLGDTRYRGIFAVDEEPLWWADKVADWWTAIDPEHRLFVNATGEERCTAVQEVLGLAKLNPITEDPNSPGPYYWTTCIVSNRPVDPMNAYAITPDVSHREWHDLKYMCREEAFQRARDPRFDESERARIMEDRG